MSEAHDFEFKNQIEGVMSELRAQGHENLRCWPDPDQKTWQIEGSFRGQSYRFDANHLIQLQKIAKLNWQGMQTLSARLRFSDGLKKEADELEHTADAL